MTQQRALKILSQRNLDIIFDIARYQLLSTRQVHELHFAPAGSSETASAKLLARLAQESNGFLQHTYTYGKTRLTAHGLSKTRPDKVWYFPPACQARLRKALAKLGRVSEYDRFLDYVKVFNKDQTFSDQVLPHELGINSCLMALEAQAELHDLRDFTWIRTSPRSKITGTTVYYKNAQNQTRRGTINPDAVIFFRAWKNDELKPYFFYLEYESGTKDGFEYRRDKIIPYRAYVYQSRKPDRRDDRTRYFDEIGRNIAIGYGLEIPADSEPTFRVLTVSRETNDAGKLFTASTAIPSDELFLFTDLESFLADPYAEIWLRKKEFSESGLLEEFDKRDQMVARSEMQYSVFLKWTREMLETELKKAAIF